MVIRKNRFLYDFTGFGLRFFLLYFIESRLGWVRMKSYFCVGTDVMFFLLVALYYLSKTLCLVAVSLDKLITIIYISSYFWGSVD